MQIEKEEILHIANLASLNIKEDEIDKYRKNLQEILEFTTVVDSIDTDNINETIGITNNSNVFRKDEIVEFKDNELLLKNAPEQDSNMFKIPKVI